MSSITAILLDFTTYREAVIDKDDTTIVREWYTTLMSSWEEYPGCLAATLATIAEAVLFKSMSFMHLVSTLYYLYTGTASK